MSEFSNLVTSRLADIEASRAAHQTAVEELATDPDGIPAAIDNLIDNKNFYNKWARRCQRGVTASAGAEGQAESCG